MEVVIYPLPLKREIVFVATFKDEEVIVTAPEPPFTEETKGVVEERNAPIA